MKALIAGVTAVSLGLLGLGACSHERSGPGTTTTTSAGIVGGDSAAAAIAHARCNREHACNNIGAGQKFETIEACTTELGHNERATLRAEECPRGVSNNALNQCLENVHNEHCGNPVDSVNRIASCSRVELCR
jgi:hypothetical protein